MTSPTPSSIFLVTAPGLEAVVAAEARAKGFGDAKTGTGGVTIQGTWPDVWRANLELRGPSKILARIGQFRVLHLAQLDKRARKVAWSDVLRADIPFRVEAACTNSRIYHSGAAAQRIERAICDTLGAPAAKDAEVAVMARIDDDLCTLSIDASGEPLHKRGYKQAVAKAPMRENLAACFLSLCGYDGSEPVVDPMCGSGTFVIEAAEIAAGLRPGRSRPFAFEQLATFDEAAWTALLSSSSPHTPAANFYGSDHDAGAIRMSLANAKRADVGGMTQFRQCAINDLTAPEGPTGLVIVNPPYGARIGDKGHLNALYHSLGYTLRQTFKGWRVGLVTSEPSLAHATELNFVKKSAPVGHGGLRITLYQTAPLS